MKDREFQGANIRMSEGRRSDTEPRMTLKELREIDLSLHPDAGMRQLLKILEDYERGEMYKILDQDLQREWEELKMDVQESIRNPLVEVKPLEDRLKNLLGILESKTKKAN